MPPFAGGSQRRTEGTAWVFVTARSTQRTLRASESCFWEILSYGPERPSSGKLYTEVIESSLNQALRRPAARVEVINAGIPGYTTYQELEFLKLYGLDMQPDLVVLGFVFNDLYYPYLHRPTADMRLDKEPSILLHRFDTRTFPASLFVRSHLAHRLVFEGRRGLWKLTGHPFFRFERRGDTYLAWTSYGWDTTTPLLREMRDLLAQQGRKLAIVVFPAVEQVDNASRELDLNHVLYPQRRIGEICAVLALPRLDGGPSCRRWENALP